MASIRFLPVLLIGAFLIAFTSAGTGTGFLESTDNKALLKELYTRKSQIKEWVLARVFSKAQGPKAVEIDCSTCQLAITLAFSFLEQGTPEEVQEGLIGLCQDLQIVADDVCEGIVHLEFPDIYYILTNRYLTVADVCGVILQNTEGCMDVNTTMTDWTIDIDPTKPEIIDPELLPADIPTAKVLHLTDIHPDLHYSPNSLTDCGKPMCCRSGPTWEEPWNSSVEAGEWGDYACDIPKGALTNLFEDAAKRYKDDYKFVMLGGDYVHHSVWNTTKEDNIAHYTAVANALFTAFPNTPVYPVVGNHEPHPVNLFPPTSVWDTTRFNNQWVYENLVNIFGGNLTDAAKATFRKAGYYSVVTEPGFRLVVLNTNLCYILNFWILYESADPEGQLQWFAETMLEAEKAEERVFILGHVPPGDVECWSVWNAHFNAVVNRFENIIMGQFYGHTHWDDFKIFFDEDRPINSLYIGSSVTAYTDLNPGYKVFHVDGVESPDRNTTWEIVDHESWIYSLPEANQMGAPDWFKLYSAREAYNLPSLRPKHLYQFVLEMARNDTLFQKFYTHFNKDSDTMLPCTDEDDCRRDYLCNTLTSNDADKAHCADLDAIFTPDP